jgi:hypothetical protein
MYIFISENTHPARVLLRVWVPRRWVAASVLLQRRRQCSAARGFDDAEKKTGINSITMVKGVFRFCIDRYLITVQWNYG